MEKEVKIDLVRTALSKLKYIKSRRVNQDALDEASRIFSIFMKEYYQTGQEMTKEELLDFLNKKNKFANKEKENLIKIYEKNLQIKYLDGDTSNGEINKLVSMMISFLSYLGHKNSEVKEKKGILSLGKKIIGKKESAIKSEEKKEGTKSVKVKKKKSTHFLKFLSKNKVTKKARKKKVEKPTQKKKIKVRKKKNVHLLNFLNKKKISKKVKSKKIKKKSRKNKSPRARYTDNEIKALEKLARERARKAREAQKKLAQKRAIKARKARLARERAVKARKARLVRERAIKARKAKLARERAIKARKARLARERAIKARKARLAKERAIKARKARLVRERAMKVRKAKNRLVEEKEKAKLKLKEEIIEDKQDYEKKLAEIDNKIKSLG